MANLNDLEVGKFDSTSGVVVQVADTRLPAAALLADNVALPTAPLVGAVNVLYDPYGANLDLQRANVDAVVLPSAVYTTTQTLSGLVNHNGRYLTVSLHPTLNAGTLGSITLTIYGQDPLTGGVYVLLAGAAVTAPNVVVAYRVGPGLLAAANAVANFPVPRLFAIVVTANNANPMTYSVTYSLGL